MNSNKLLITLLLSIGVAFIVGPDKGDKPNVRNETINHFEVVKDSASMKITYKLP